MIIFQVRKMTGTAIFGDAGH